MAEGEVERVERDGAEIVGAVAGAAAVVALLPAVVVAVIVIVVLRVLRRQWWWSGAPAVIAVAVVALVPGLTVALHDYTHSYGAVISTISHHRHVGLGAVLLGVLPLAVALGLVLGVVGAGLAERRWAIDGTKRARAGQPHDGRGMRADAPTAKRREVRDLVVPASESRRLVLGRAHHRWLAAQADDHVVTIAPTGSGKTTSLVIPAVLRLGGPLVVTSSKGDVIEDRAHGTGTLAHRASMGACHIFDPSAATPYPCVPWSPLGRAATWQGALRVARTMLSASGRGQGSESGTSSFFAARAEQSLAPLLHAAALAEADMSDVLRWVRTRDWSEAEAVLSGDALESLGNLTSGSKESLGDTLATILTVLRAFEDPMVARNTSEPIWSPSELVESVSDTLYVVYGPDAERLAPVYTALIDEIVSAARERTLRLGKALDPPLWLLLDEAGTGLAIPELPSTLARSRGEGIRMLTVWQDLGQIRRIYGDEGRSGILGNSAAQCWWPPDDGDTARYLSDALGHQQVKQVSRSKSKRGAESESESESISTVAVLDAGEARTLAGPLLLYRGRPPLALEPVPYWRDAELSRRSKESLPTLDLPVLDEPVEGEPVVLAQ